MKCVYFFISISLYKVEPSNDVGLDTIFWLYLTPHTVTPPATSVVVGSRPSVSVCLTPSTSLHLPIPVTFCTNSVFVKSSYPEQLPLYQSFRRYVYAVLPPPPPPHDHFTQYRVHLIFYMRRTPVSIVDGPILRVKWTPCKHKPLTTTVVVRSRNIVNTPSRTLRPRTRPRPPSGHQLSDRFHYPLINVYPPN